MKDHSADFDFKNDISNDRQQREKDKCETLKLDPEMRVDTPPNEARDTSDKLGTTIDAETGPIARKKDPPPPAPPGGGGGGGRSFHKRIQPEDYGASMKRGMAAVRLNLIFVFILTCATNLLVLSIPIYLFQISDRVLTSRSVDTLIMLSVVIVGAVILQSILDAVRRFMLMRTAVEVAAQLGAPILSAAAHASLNGNGREYQTLGDLQQLRGFLVSGTLISFLDVPFAPLFMLAIYLVHPDLGMIVLATAGVLFVIAIINQKVTSKPFAVATMAQSKANLHLDSMSRNSQVINAMAMIPEAVSIWGRDTAASLTAQVRAQDRNIVSAAISRGIRLLTQVGLLGWGAYLAIQGEITGGMVIAASIIAGRALAPVEGSIEGWNTFLLTRAAYGRIRTLLSGSKLQFERLWLPNPEGRLDVERLLYVPGGTKQVVLNGLSFSLHPGEALAVIGNSGAGKTTLGKMLVGSILPTSGNVRLDLMDLRNWDPRQMGENIGYLPQDVQLFPGTIKQNIGRMQEGATDEQIHRAAVLADVHDMIAQLPQGYETMVAADGSPLSGGQKQRIALARAFFGDPRFLVLDEPNSNLDVAGDKALAKAIEHARANKITSVIITQKPALLNVVDKIMLLANGNISLFGERTQVMAKLAEDRNRRAASQSVPPPNPKTPPNLKDEGPENA
ncbi:type I secretion system permease/ATPase [Roseovarius sp. EL26]|uniref:type I secretion system permease/ATPase n=1 Tax=Roseovarius sp. EL26 TaxID=2126672 RepID=UPI0020B1275B|nr:type I secretion system permease/ATPase [Roseovarius sp. EL26]